MDFLAAKCELESAIEPQRNALLKKLALEFDGAMVMLSEWPNDALNFVRSTIASEKNGELVSMQELLLSVSSEFFKLCEDQRAQLLSSIEEFSLKKSGDDNKYAVSDLVARCYPESASLDVFDRWASSTTLEKKFWRNLGAK
jgi:hypothetical protein